MTLRKSRRHTRRSLRTESLENRQMMAGDVTARFINDDIYITGDFEPNTIEISQAGDILTIEGQDDTTINGSENAHEMRLTRNVNGRDRYILDDIFIEMGNGTDRVSLDNVEVGNPNLPSFRQRNDLSIDLGRGDNRLSMNDVYVKGDLEIDATPSWAGDNWITTSELDVARDLSIYTARGNDLVIIDNSEVGDDLHISNSRGNDNVFVMNSTIGDNVNVDVGSGDDLIMFRSTQADDIYAVGNRGEDAVVMIDVVVTDLIRVDSGHGDDIVDIRNSHSDRLVLYTGYGEDEVHVSARSTTRRLWLDTGHGNDFVNLDNLDAVFGSIHGGLGATDVLRVNHMDPLVEGRMEASQTGFESVQ